MKRYLAGLLIWCLPAQAQWSNDPAVNNPVFTGPYGQRGITVVSDGTAGAFAFWLNLNVDTVGIYAQSVDAGGNRVRSQPAQLFQYSVVGAVPKDAIPDGSRGAILTWSAKVSGSITDADIYAQRLDPDLNSSWANIVVCDAVNFQSRPRVASDSAGGAIIAWEDRRDAGVSRVYAQHLDSNGDSLWTRNGLPLVTTTSQAHFNPMIVADGSGGVIVVWEDIKAFLTRLYAQRLNAAGEPQWADTGAAVYFYPTGPALRGLVEDGAGGAFVCWQDRNSHGDNNVYVQRLDASGNRAWDPFGVMLSASNKAVNPSMIADGNGGAIIAWEDSSLGAREVNIYAQRVGPSGALLWPAPVPVSTAPFEQYYFSMIPRGNDGAIIAWTDARDWPIPPGLTGLDVYAQSIDGNGVAQWQSDGAPVSQPPAPAFATSAQAFPALAGDGNGGGIAFWEDSRNAGNSADIYAQGLAAIGFPLRMTSRVTAANAEVPFTTGGNTLLTANFDTLGTVDTMTVQAFINAMPPGLTRGVPRYFHLTANGSGFNVTLSFNYTDAEVAAAGLANGDLNLRMYRNSGSGWELQGGTVDTGANTVTVAGVTGFSFWAMRDPNDTLLTDVVMSPGLPGAFRLEQNFPNPFNPTTRIRYVLPTSSYVTLTMYNLLGQEVATLVDGMEDPGHKVAEWDASRYGLTSGIYFYRLQAGTFVETKKLLLMK